MITIYGIIDSLVGTTNHLTTRIYPKQESTLNVTVDGPWHATPTTTTPTMRITIVFFACILQRDAVPMDPIANTCTEYPPCTMRREYPSQETCLVERSTPQTEKTWVEQVHSTENAKHCTLQGS